MYWHAVVSPVRDRPFSNRLVIEVFSFSPRQSANTPTRVVESTNTHQRSIPYIRSIPSSESGFALKSSHRSELLRAMPLPIDAASSSFSRYPGNVFQQIVTKKLSIEFYVHLTDPI